MSQPAYVLTALLLAFVFPSLLRRPLDILRVPPHETPAGTHQQPQKAEISPTAIPLGPDRRAALSGFATALPGASPRDASHRSRPDIAPATSTATAAGIWSHTTSLDRQRDPLERQLDSLRRQLAQTRASIAELSTAAAAGGTAAVGVRPEDSRRDHGGGSAIGTGSLTAEEHHQQQQEQQKEKQQLLRVLWAQEQQLRLDVAVALQQLNQQQPDGGRRLPEAEEHYRAVIVALDKALAEARGLGGRRTGGGSSGEDGHGGHDGDNGSFTEEQHPQRERQQQQLQKQKLLAMRLQVVGNLVALMLEAERPQDALEEMETALQLQHAQGAGRLQSASTAAAAAVPPAVLCGLRFNRGKALAAVGRLAEADAAYVQTALGAVGQDADCFAKACAAMTRLPDKLLALVQSAVQLAEESGLRRQLLALSSARLDPGAEVPTASAPPPQAAAAAAAGDEPFGDRSRALWLSGIGVSELGWLYFALGRALDERGAAAWEVWRVLERANSLLSSQQPYDPDHDWHQLRTLTAVFGGPLLRAAAAAVAAAGSDGGSFQDDSPLFVVGLPRSGSTLVETMLSRYPGVWAAGEDTALAPLTPAINRLLSTQGLSQPSALGDFGRRYLEDMRRRAVAAGWDGTRPPVRIVDKMLRNLWLIGYIEMLLPRSCIIHVVRHPLDVALSCYSQPFGYSGVPWSWQLQHIGEQIRMAAALAAHWREHLPPGRILTLRYEELVAAPEVSARRLLSHCGLDWDPRVLSFQEANRTVATASVSQVRRPLYNTSVGRWRKYEQQLAGLAELIRPEILSYEAELAAALRRAAEAEARRLQFQRPDREGLQGEVKEAPRGRQRQQQRNQDGERHAAADAAEAAAAARIPRDEL